MRRWQLIDRALRDKEGEGGGGGGGDRKPDVSAQLEGLVAAHGDAKAALRVLYSENYDLREARRKLQEQLEVRQEVPKDGIVLDATQAAAWKKYEALGKPEDLEAAVTERGELREKVATAERKELTDAAAAACDWRPEVLSKMPGAEKLRFEVKEETVDGEKVKVAYVTTGEQGATPQKLTDYAEAQWKEFLPSLEAEAEAGGGPRDESRRMVRQAPKGRAPVKGPKSVEDIADSKRGDASYAAL